MQYETTSYEKQQIQIEGNEWKENILQQEFAIHG